MKVASFYRFLDLEDPSAFRERLEALCREQALLGTVLVAPEGFNGTLAGSEQAIRAVSPGSSKRYRSMSRSKRAGPMLTKRRSGACAYA